MAAARSNPAARALAGLRSAHSALNDCKEKTAGCERSPGGRTSTFITSLRRKGALLGARGREITHMAVTMDVTCLGPSGKCVDGLTDTPGSVIPCRCRQRSGGHPSTNAVAGALQQPTRTLGRAALKRVLSGLAPGGVYLASPVTQGAGGLLHHRFTLTCRVLMQASPRAGGLFSVALACGLPRVGVTHHPALRSPDVPRATCVTRDRLVNPSAVQSTGVEGCLRPR